MKQEKNNGKKISWEELLYYLFFGILFAAKGVGLDAGQKLFTCCIAAALLCLAGKLCITKYTLKEWFVMALLVGLGCLIRHSSGETAALFAVFVIIGMKNIPVKRLFKVCLGIWSVTFGLSMVLGILHIRDGVVVVHQKLGLGPIVRWSWGYTHPNVLHVSYFVLASLILYVWDLHGKKLWKASAALFAGNLFVFLYSISYTGVLIVTGYLALNLYLDARKTLSAPERILLQCILPVCVLFPLAGPFVTSGRVFDFFNNLLSTRFELVKNFYTHFSPSLFGTAAYFNTTAHLTLDSSFAYLLMYYGIAAFVLFITGYFVLIYRFIKRGQKKELAILTGIVVAGVTEQFLFNLSFKNLSFFFLGELLFELLQSRGQKATVWNRERALLPVKASTVTIPPLNTGVKKAELAETFRQKNIRIVTAAVFAVSVIVISVFIKMPDSIYVNRNLTEYRKQEEEVSLDLDQVPEDFNSMVIGYAGPDVGMYHFSGNIIKLEFVRNVAGGSVLVTACVFWAMVGFNLHRRKRSSCES